MIEDKKPIAKVDFNSMARASKKAAEESSSAYLQKATIINPSMYDKKIEKLQSYGSKWNTYGYNPNRDNEKAYDQLTTDSEQWKRSMKGAAKLAVIGLTDNALFGAFSNSKKNANEFGKVADIYSTQRGGVGGFTQNLLLNSGYTLGIMTDMLLEEAALAGITMATGGLSLPATGVGMAGKAASSLYKISNAWSDMNNLRKAVNSVNAASDISKLGKVGNFALKAMPLENSIKFARALKNVKSVKELSTLTKGIQGGAAIYRDVKAIHLAVSEANLEANMLEKDMYDEYISKNPYMTEDDRKELEKNVANAKWLTKAQNTAAIFATNKLVFNNMYKRFDDLKGVGTFLNTGKFGRLAATDGGVGVIRTGNIFQKGFYQGIKDQSKLLFEKGALSALSKIGKSGVSTFGKYGISNLGEGLQETIQETIQSMNKNYFGNKAAGTYFDSVVHGLKEQWSEQGAETFLSGFLMGGLIHPVTATVTKPIEFFKNGDYKQFTDSESFKRNREAKLKALQDDVSIINEAYTNVGAVFNSMGNDLATQSRLDEEMTMAAAEGDRDKFQDKKDESYRTHLHTMMKHGTLDAFIKHAEGFKSMEPKQAAETFGLSENISPEKINETINKKIEQAKKFKVKYEKIKTDFPSPVNLSKLDKNDTDYFDKLNKHHLWNKAVDDLIFNTAEFEQNLDRKIELLDTLKNDLELNNVPYHLYNTITSNELMNTEIQTLSTEIKALKGFDTLTPEATKDLKNKQARVDSLIRYQETLGEVDRISKEINELETKEKLTPAETKALRKLNQKLNTSTTQLRDRHTAYINNIQDQPGSNPRIDKLAKESFDKLYAYYKLDKRNTSLEESIYTLGTPQALDEESSRWSKFSALIIENQKNFVRQSIAKFRDEEDADATVKELLDLGVSFDLSEMDELLEKGIMPSVFYDITTEEELKKSDPKFKLAQQKLNELVDNLINQPIVERDRDLFGELGRGARIKDTDKRTYSELAKEYGFDVKQIQKTKDILNIIINSKNSTQSEKELAKLILKLTSDDSTITFSDLSSRPNTYSKEEGSIVDARYSANNYTNSLFSLEESILKNEIQRLTESALAEDKAFRESVKKLRLQVIEFIKSEKSNETADTKPEEQLRTDWKGLVDEQEFIKEAFGNQSFQVLLARVADSSNQKTTWEKLIDALINLVAGTLNVKSSVYNSVVTVVQQKIDPSKLDTPTITSDTSETKTEKEKVEEEEEEEKPDGVSQTPINKNDTSTFPKVLLNKLIGEYKKAVKVGDAVDKKIDTLTVDSLTPGFNTWLNNELKAQKIISDYIEEVEGPILTNADSLSSEEKSLLAGLGYSKEDVNNMAVDELERVLEESKTKTETIDPTETVVEELINENINIVTDEEEDSEEETITPVTGTEGASDTTGSETTEEEVTKTPRELALDEIEFVAADMDYYQTPLSSTRFTTKTDAEKFVNDYYDKLEQPAPTKKETKPSIYQQLVKLWNRTAKKGMHAYAIQRNGQPNPPVVFQGVVIATSNNGYKVKKEDGSESGWINYSDTSSGQPNFLFSDTKLVDENQAETPKQEVPVEKETQSKPKPNKTMHNELVAKLKTGKKISVKITSFNGKTVVAELEDGRKIKFYDHNNAVSVEDKDSIVELRLNPLVTTPNGVKFTDVIEVYAGDKFMGNVAEQDYEEKEKINISPNASETKITEAATTLVDNYPELFLVEVPVSIFAELGYSEQDLESISAADKKRILKGKIKREEFSPTKRGRKAKAKIERDDVLNAIVKFLNKKQSEIDKVETEAELLKIYEELTNTVPGYESKLPFIQNSFAEIRKQLAIAKKFSSVKENTKLLLSDGTVVKVTSTKNGQLEVVDFNSIVENKRTISESNFDTEVKKVINDFNKDDKDVMSAIDEKNLDELSNIMANFTGSTLSISDTDVDVSDEDMLNHFKLCK